MRIRVNQVENQLREIRGQEVTTTAALPHTLTRGDRVRITNKIKRPASWTAHWDVRDNVNERKATVTHTVREQVWVITDNGTKTWRSRNKPRTNRLDRR